jgi:hypothetical protein
MRLELEELRKWKADNAPKSKPKDEPKPTIKTSVISLIDDSDSDSEGENADVSESKITKAIKSSRK